MKKRPIHFSYIVAISVIIIVLVAYKWTSSKSYSIENKIWDVCVKTDFANPDEKCNYLITYVFNKDGTFYEYSKSASDSIQKIQLSRVMKWKLEGNHLKFNVHFENFDKEIEYKIKWVDDSRFYTVETNSFDVTTETWYQATDVIKK